MTYIFDFDGTLVDSMPVFGKTMLRILDENKIDYPEDIVNIITPMGYSGTAEYVIGLGLKMTAEEFIKKAIDYNTYEYHNTIPAKEFVIEKLRELRKRGDSLNVLTASPHYVLDECLKRLGIYELFDNVWSCDDFGCAKSEVRIYQEAAARLGKNTSECCFVDDNVGAVSTAKSSGMIAVGVYDKSSQDFTEEIKKNSDRYILNFSEL